MHRLLIASLAAAALTLAGCGDDTTATGDIEGITVSKTGTPKVKVAQDFAAASTEVKVVAEGAGDVVGPGDTVQVNYLAVNGRTGEEFDSTYAAGRPTLFTLNDENGLPGFVKALEGQKVGSRVVAALAPSDGLGPRTDLEIEADDTVVFVFDLVAKLPSEVTGETKELPATVPTLEVDDDGRPTGFETGDDVPDAPEESSAHVVIEGDGETVEQGQDVSVQYLGQVYPDGKVFDSSFSRNAPASFVMARGQLVPDCWADELVGQKVGSRVVLVCPADTAYGDEGRAPDIAAGDTLLFAIDLLAAS